MVARADVGVHRDVVALGGAGQDADEDLPQPRRRAQQEAPLKRPGGDFDQRSVGDEAQPAAHVPMDGIGCGKLAEDQRSGGGTFGTGSPALPRNVSGTLRSVHLAERDRRGEGAGVGGGAARQAPAPTRDDADGPGRGLGTVGGPLA